VLMLKNIRGSKSLLIWYYFLLFGGSSIWKLFSKLDVQPNDDIPSNLIQPEGELISRITLGAAEVMSDPADRRRRINPTVHVTWRPTKGS